MKELRIGDPVYIHGYIDEIRKDSIIIKNDGGYFGTVESEVIPVDGLCTEEDCVNLLNDILEELDSEAKWGEPTYDGICFAMLIIKNHMNGGNYGRN